MQPAAPRTPRLITMRSRAYQHARTEQVCSAGTARALPREPSSPVDWEARRTGGQAWDAPHRPLHLAGQLGWVLAHTTWLRVLHFVFHQRTPSGLNSAHITTVGRTLGHRRHRIIYNSIGWHANEKNLDADHASSATGHVRDRNLCAMR